MAGNRSPKIHVDSISPAAVIPGGQLTLRGSGMDGDERSQPEVSFGGEPGRLVVSTPERLVVTVPDTATTGTLQVRSATADSGEVPFALGRLLGSEVHPVANPAVDSEGNVFTTQSGTRGKKTPVSVYKIAHDGGSVSAFLTGVINPTGLLFQPDGSLLVSSRHEGTVYEVSPTGKAEVFAEGMGVATGLAIDGDQNVYVGDRTGTVFKISRERKIYVFATLEPSVAAYHMAVGPEGVLYVTAPTTSSCDAVHRIDPKGSVTVWFRGFGRPQGVAFDSSRRLHVCASYRGQRGIFRLTDSGVEQTVSGQGIVGLAFAPDDSLVVATGNSVYRIPDMG